MSSELSVIETDAVGVNVTVGEFSVIRAGVVIGDNVTIHPHVVIEPGVTISSGVEIFPGSYIGKQPKGAGATARPVSYERQVVIQQDCAIGPNAVIYYDVMIGENTLVGDGASIREGCRIGSRCVVGRYVTLNYRTTVGNDVKIMDHSWLAGNVNIGHNVFISGGVLTANDNAMGIQGYVEERIVGPRIKNSARIGVGAILLPHITVAEHAVVAAGAVVTKDVSPYDVVVGVPARVVKNLRDSASDKEKRTGGQGS